MKGCLTVADLLPRNWRDYLGGRGPCGLGLDIATTTKKTSNPTSIALMQQEGLDYVCRLVLRFKTQDPAVTTAIVRELCTLPHGLKVRKACADATNERFFVANLKRELAGTVVVVPIIYSEAVEYRGQKMLTKAFLGNQMVNTFEDGHVLLPNEKWLENDLRQMKRSAGTFEAEIDAAGNHADAWNAIQLGLHALMRLGGPVEAEGVRVGTFGAVAKAVGAWVRNPFARRAGDEQRLC